jgi:hypothetical protein
VIPFVVEVDKLGYSTAMPGCRASNDSIPLERATGVEPATSSLGSWHSTTELRPLCA